MTTLTTLLVGSHFNPPAKALLSAIPEGSEVTLTRDEENQFDPLAIKVWVAVSEIEPMALDEEQLAGFGYSKEEIIETDSQWCLGHVAKTDGKPLEKAKGLDNRLVGNAEIYQSVEATSWPLKGTIGFRGDELITITLEI
jgi:hypothetical protein